MGRPALPQHQRRDRRIEIRVTEWEYHVLRLRMAQAGFGDLSSYLRTVGSSTGIEDTLLWGDAASVCEYVDTCIQDSVLEVLYELETCRTSPRAEITCAVGSRLQDLRNTDKDLA